jgi:hypothetical protein
MKKTSLFLCIFLSIAFCKKEADKTVVEKQFLFTDSLTGTELYETPETTGKIFTTIPHATKVELSPDNPSYTMEKDSLQ